MNAHYATKAGAYAAAVGLLGLAIYQFTQGNSEQFMQSLMGAFAAFSAAYGYSRTATTEEK